MAAAALAGAAASGAFASALDGEIAPLTAALLLGTGAVLVSTLLAFLSLRNAHRRMRAANDALAASNAGLQQALKARTEFLATTSHEIRNPLNGMLGMAELILADPELPPALRERMRLLQGAGFAMRALVDDLLDMTKLETGPITIETAPFDLKALLDETIRFWSAEASVRGVSLRLAAGPLPARVLGDQKRLRQVLFNLISNALKFTPGGEILLSARVEDGALIIACKDSGIGVAPDRQGMIFDPFAQADPGASRRYGGAGLGLAICRSICEAMGGTIGVESTPGVGSTFTIRVPGEVVEAAKSAEAAGLACAAVLLLDANPLSRNIVRALLEPKVGRLALAASLAEAVEHLHVDGVDLVLAEGASLQAAGGTMAASLHTLKQALPHGRVAVLAAAADADQIPLLELAGASEVIVKPVSGQALLARLTGLFETPAARASRGAA